MRWLTEYAVKIKTNDDGWTELRLQTSDIRATVQAELAERGVAFKNYSVNAPEGYRCVFHFWDQGKDKDGAPKTIAAANEIFA